jgi:hypothetical protein
MGIVQELNSLTAADRAARVDLAAAFRLAVRPEVQRDTYYRMILADSPEYAVAHFGALKRILEREQHDFAR